MEGNGNTKHIGVQVSDLFFRKVKVALAQKGQSAHDAVVTALGQYLNMSKKDIEKEVNTREREPIST